MQCNAPNHHHHCHHCSTIQCNDAPNFHQARKILSIKLSSSFFSSKHLFQAIDHRTVQSTEQNIAKMQRRRTQLVGNGENTDQNQSEYFTHRCDSCPSWVVGSGHNYIQQVGMYSLLVEIGREATGMEKLKKTRFKHLKAGGRLSDGWKLVDTVNGISVNRQLFCQSKDAFSICQNLVWKKIHNLEQVGALNFRCWGLRLWGVGFVFVDLLVLQSGNCPAGESQEGLNLFG